MILVTGANGQLGSELRELTQNSSNFIFKDMDLDITDRDALDLFFSQNKIDCVINCAAYTAVDKAEMEPELAKKINTYAAGLLAEFATKYNFVLIQISTDFIFDGKSTSPYSEKCKISPISVYGKTKADGEELIIKSHCKAIILRTAWLYSAYGNNFVKTIMRLGYEKEQFGVIFDQIGTPTWAKDLARSILVIVDKIQANQLDLKEAIVLHYSNEGVASWYDFAISIKKSSGFKAEISPFRTFQYPTPAARPQYSVLDKKKIKDLLQINIPYWQDSLEACLKEIATKQ